MTPAASLSSISITCLLAFDRYVSSSRSVYVRSFSNMKVARYSTLILCLLWSFVNIPSLIYYDVIRSANGILACTIVSSPWKEYTFYFQVPILYGIVPITLLSALGTLTTRNVYIIKQNQRRRSQRTYVDEQTTKMILMQIIVFILCKIPYCVQTAYTLFTAQLAKDPLRTAEDSLFVLITRYIFTIDFCSPFYIFILSSKPFRERFIVMIRKLCCSDYSANRVGILSANVERRPKQNAVVIQT
ncbi:unnamed protein product [Didymodactylos carnosus]|uniref:G-protein coupled receptors family 1 profile domain-containing protein n=1 Tax=Didymodactylos carnosus TaxID=1234261 RepID=A0A815KHK4_9BILA|nr:unnamed protein product [Didymodactylos carnosus]CAF4287669.1 unnamed protein product [Didymodactylos carnosus]CAF4313439.1 unnamed protein product [Didymodactylos carnosus]